MIGFFFLMSLLAVLVSFGSYWISWEVQDVQTRPRFAAQFRRDCARLLRGSRNADPARTPAATRAARTTGSRV